MTKDEIANIIAGVYATNPDMSGRQINRLQGAMRRRTEDAAGEIAETFERRMDEYESRLLNLSLLVGEKTAQWSEIQELVKANGHGSVTELLVAYDKLAKPLREFIEANRVTCPETVYQTDWVAENALPLIETLVERIGYLKTED